MKPKASPQPTLEEILQILRRHLPEFKERYGVKSLGVFGSYVRGEQRAGSDLDVLIDLDEPVRISLLNLVHLENSLSDLLGVKVDLVIERNLKPRLRPDILQEVVRL